MNGKGIVSLNAFHLYPKWHPLCIEIDWSLTHKPGNLDLKHHVPKIKHTRGAGVTYLEIRIASLVMNCALINTLRTGIFFLCIYHRSLIRSEVTFL
jgi:hypothetical protein